jgi:hypothetical protein
MGLRTSATAVRFGLSPIDLEWFGLNPITRCFGSGRTGGWRHQSPAEMGLRMLRAGRSGNLDGIPRYAGECRVKIRPVLMIPDSIREPRWLS